MRTDLSDDRHRVVTVRETGDAGRLWELALEILGRRDRPAGWFSRKLVRECVDPDLSVALVELDGRSAERCARDLRQLRGYVLVGTPPSVRPRARTAGVGVVREFRGRGLGRRLLMDACERARRAGYDAIQTLSTAATEPFYLQVGFTQERSETTLLTFGTGGRDPTWGHGEANVANRYSLCGWIPEAWQRTPAAERCVLELRDGDLQVVAHVSREGRAVLVQGLSSDGPAPREAGWAAISTALRARFEEGTPILLYGCESGGSVVRTLQPLGWTEAQRASVLVRTL